jgi:hypothetical protein
LRSRQPRDDTTTLQSFPPGLPLRLAESCIDIESPSTFTQGALADRRQQENWLRKCYIHENYDTVLDTVEKSQTQRKSRWGWKRTGKTGRTRRGPPDPPSTMTSVKPTTSQPSETGWTDWLNPKNTTPPRAATTRRAKRRDGKAPCPLVHALILGPSGPLCAAKPRPGAPPMALQQTSVGGSDLPATHSWAMDEFLRMWTGSC